MDKDTSIPVGCKVGSHQSPTTLCRAQARNLHKGFPAALPSAEEQVVFWGEKLQSGVCLRRFSSFPESWWLGKGGQATGMGMGTALARELRDFPASTSSTGCSCGQEGPGGPGNWGPPVLLPSSSGGDTGE